MKKLAFALFALFLSIFSYAQIEGYWKTIDDKTNKAKSIVKIYKSSNGKYYGKIHKLLIKPTNDKCVECKGDRKNKPLIGLDIIRGLKKNGDEFTGGTITDPKTGKTYKCTVKRNGSQLKVRGYIGFSLIGRTQTWQEVK